jgi:hypothetical protein
MKFQTGRFFSSRMMIKIELLWFWRKACFP